MCDAGLNYCVSTNECRARGKLNVGVCLVMFSASMGLMFWFSFMVAVVLFSLTSVIRVGRDAPSGGQLTLMLIGGRYVEAAKVSRSRQSDMFCVSG